LNLLSYLFPSHSIRLFQQGFNLTRYHFCIRTIFIMHQHLRHAPATASPANSPQTNPSRTNNPREGSQMVPENTDPGGHGGRGGPEGDMAEQLQRPTRTTSGKLDQIVQVG